jgi:hypothetical protein
VDGRTRLDDTTPLPDRQLKNSAGANSAELPASVGGVARTRPIVRRCVALPSGAYEEGGHDIRVVPVEGNPRPVLAHRRTRVGVAGRLLHVAEGDTRVEGGGYERVRGACAVRPAC